MQGVRTSSAVYQRAHAFVRFEKRVGQLSDLSSRTDFAMKQPALKAYAVRRLDAMCRTYQKLQLITVASLMAAMRLVSLRENAKETRAYGLELRVQQVIGIDSFLEDFCSPQDTLCRLACR